MFQLRYIYSIGTSLLIYYTQVKRFPEYYFFLPVICSLLTILKNIGGMKRVLLFEFVIGLSPFICPSKRMDGKRKMPENTCIQKLTILPILLWFIRHTFLGFSFIKNIIQIYNDRLSLDSLFLLRMDLFYLEWNYVPER